MEISPALVAQNESRFDALARPKNSVPALPIASNAAVKKAKTTKEVDVPSNRNFFYGKYEESEGKALKAS